MPVHLPLLHNQDTSHPGSASGNQGNSQTQSEILSERSSSVRVPSLLTNADGTTVSLSKPMRPVVSPPSLQRGSGSGSPVAPSVGSHRGRMLRKQNTTETSPDTGSAGSISRQRHNGSDDGRSDAGSEYSSHSVSSVSSWRAPGWISSRQQSSSSGTGTGTAGISGQQSSRNSSVKKNSSSPSCCYCCHRCCSGHIVICLCFFHYILLDSLRSSFRGRWFVSQRFCPLWGFSLAV